MKVAAAPRLSCAIVIFLLSVCIPEETGNTEGPEISFSIKEPSGPWSGVDNETASPPSSDTSRTQETVGHEPSSSQPDHENYVSESTGISDFSPSVPTARVDFPEERTGHPDPDVSVQPTTNFSLTTRKGPQSHSHGQTEEIREKLASNVSMSLDSQDDITHSLSNDETRTVTTSDQASAISKSPGDGTSPHYSQSATSSAPRRAWDSMSSTHIIPLLPTSNQSDSTAHFHPDRDDDLSNPGSDNTTPNSHMPPFISILITATPVSPTGVAVDMWMGLILPHCHSLMSCGGRCGEAGRTVNSPVDDTDPMLSTGGTVEYCKCDRLCAVLGDCCQDFFSLCEGIDAEEDLYRFIDKSSLIMTDIARPHRNTAELLVVMYKQYGTCTFINYYHGDERAVENIWVISVCPQDFVDEYGGEIKTQCENRPSQTAFSFPVSHRWIPDLVFKNIFCAMCHEYQLRDILFWNVEMKYFFFERQIENLHDFFIFINGDLGHISESAPRIPHGVKLRSCIFHDQYVSSCDAQYLEHIKSVKLADPVASIGRQKLCASYFRPVIIQERPYSNIHCAACGHVSVIDIPPYFLFCSPSEERYMLQFPELIAELRYTIVKTDNLENAGVLELITYPSSRSEVTGLNHCLYKEPPALFLQACKSITCPKEPDLLHYHPEMTHMETACSIMQLDYTDSLGKLLLGDNPIPGYTDLYVEFHYNSIYDHIDVMFKDVRVAFTEVLVFYGIYKEASVITPFTTFGIMGTTLRMNWVTAEPSVHIFNYIKKMFEKLDKIQKDDSRVMSDNVTVSNYQQGKAICADEDSATIIHNVTLVVHNFEVYVYYHTGNCFFRLDNVGYQLAMHGDYLESMELNTAVLCWTPELEQHCGVKKADSDKGGTSGDNKNFPGMSFVHGTEKTSGYRRSDSRAFRTLCYIVCLLFSMLSSVSILLTRLQETQTYIFLALSQIVLAVQMILYLIAEHAVNVNGKVMGASMHFTWVFLAKSALASACVRKYLLRARKRGGSEQYANTKPTNRTILKIITGVMALSFLNVITCIITEEDRDLDVQIGFSPDNEHLFWMRNKTACYVALMMIGGICYVFVVILLIASLISLRDKDDPAHAASTDDVQVKHPRKMARIIFNSHSVHDFNQLLMFMVGICDYLDNRPELWPLLFCLLAGMGGFLSLRTALLNFLKQKIVLRTRCQIVSNRKSGRGETVRNAAVAQTIDMNGIPSEEMLATQNLGTDRDANQNNGPEVLNKL